MQTLMSLTIEESGSTVTAADTKAFLSSILAEDDAGRFARIVDASRIQRRRSLDSYAGLRRLDTLEARNALHRAHAGPTAEGVARAALERAGIEPADVDVLVVSSSTGCAVPTLDQHLSSRLRLRADARGVFLFGLGCAGAMRAVGLAGDLLRAAPARHALVVSLELCSPWLQVAEPSPEDIFSNIAFGDGAAAVVIGTPAAAGAEVVASHSVLWPDTLQARGAVLTQSGFRHFASRTLAQAIRRHLPGTVASFLAAHAVSAADLRFHVINPSDHRVLETVSSVLGISENGMRPAWAAWEQHGNTLSAGPLYVLDAVRRLAPPAPGDLGLAVAMGPGLTCDLLLLRWQGEGLN